MSGKTFSQCSSASPDIVGQDKESSPVNLDILRSLAEKKTTRDGNPAKRRGPKPDSKPALTRRQELNRQAQRTHRERKELYIKALEDEVLRLKEIYTSTSQAQEKLAEENKLLRDALKQNGIPHSGSALGDDAVSNPSGDISVTGYSHATAPQAVFTPGLSSFPNTPSISSPGQQAAHQAMGGHQAGDAARQASNGRGVDFEQAGIDFVLTYDTSSSKAYLSPPQQ